MKRARDPDALRVALADRDITTREMGLLVGCPESTIRLIVAGADVTPARARRIARVLRRPVDDLFVLVSSSGKLANVQRGAVA